MQTAVGLAQDFWSRMQTNDWDHAAKLFAPSFLLRWPLTNEAFDRKGFVAVNAAYPVDGNWRFALDHISGDANRAVTRVTVRDDANKAEVISFFETSDLGILSLIEYWPELYNAPTWRKTMQFSSRQKNSNTH